MSSANSVLLKTYFWMVHYDTTPTPQAAALGGLRPIAAGKKRMVVVVDRNVYGAHVVGFDMARDRETAPDPANFRGAPALRNRIIGFYESAAEANARMTDELWREIREKSGAVYAELHCIRVDAAESREEVLRLVA